MNLTGSEVHKHFKSWADVVKATLKQSNRQMAESMGVSRSTFDNLYYDTANTARARRDPKYLIALAYAYPEQLKAKAEKLGLKVPPPPSTPSESQQLDELQKEISLLRQQLDEHRMLLDSYKQSNSSMQDQISNKEETIKKLTETISKLSDKLI